MTIRLGVVVHTPRMVDYAGVIEDLKPAPPVAGPVPMDGGCDETDALVVARTERTLPQV